MYQLEKEKKRTVHQIKSQREEGEDMEEDIASKRAKLDDCQLEASDGHRGEGREVVPSGSHDTNTQTHGKGSFSPHVCIHTGTHTVAEYPICNTVAEYPICNVPLRLHFHITAHSYTG